MSNNFESDGYKRPQHKLTSVPSTRGILGLVFGIFMVIVYVGMGVLLFINFFNWTHDWAWTRWVVGAVLIVYGIFRGYRTYADLTGKNDN